jgi:hypothetical protein
MNKNFYNLLDYYRSVSMAKKMVKNNILTESESKDILKKLKQHYKIQEILDENHISEI